MFTVPTCWADSAMFSGRFVPVEPGNAEAVNGLLPICRFSMLTRKPLC
jgi:hypothetical protein